MKKLITFIFWSVIFSKEIITSTALATNIEIGRFCLLEIELQATNHYSNPYTRVQLKAHFDGPEGMVIDIDGYWQGADIWKLRMMPVAAGEWQYTTSSNDPGLHGKTGVFTCVESGRPGILQVNPEYPYSFRLSNGAPFFWLGETCWYLMSNAVPFADGTFQRYIDIRKEQRFNNIHFVLGTGGPPIGTDNPENEGGNLWISQDDQLINPAFFEWVDKRIAYMDSVQMGIGFYITWSQHLLTFTRAEFERFEKYLIARYGAYPLLYWIVCGEFDEAGDIEDYIHYGNVIDSVDPYDHLISIQPGHNDSENIGTNRKLAHESWLDYIVQQLPYHYSGKKITPFEVNDYILIDRTFQKPVVNDEFGYEKQHYSATIMSSDMVRKYAWSVVLGGGFASYGHTNIIRELVIDSTRSAGAKYMTHLFEFFQNMNWWNMNPNNDKVDVGLCLSGPAAHHIIYLPDSGAVEIDFTEDSGMLHAQWYDPVHGIYNAGEPATGGTYQLYVSPYPDDAVLFFREMIKPEIVVSPESLSFVAIQGDVDPAEQAVVITNNGEDLLFWTASEQPDQSWIDLQNTIGFAGDRLLIKVSISGLTEGNYDGVIRISDARASNNPVDVPVTLTVLPRAAVLIIAPDSLDFSSDRDSMDFVVTNTGGQDLQWRVVDDFQSSMITAVTPSSGTLSKNQSDTVTVMIDRNGLEEGAYQHKLHILSNGGEHDVIVTVAVASVPVIEVIPLLLDFDWKTTSRTFSITNSGDGVLTWNAFVNNDIFSITPTAGELVAAQAEIVTVTANRQHLLPGTYSGIIYVASSADTQQVLVTLEVIQPANIQISPSILNFDSTMTDLIFTITNTGGEPLFWQASEQPDQQWITYILPDRGELSPSEQAIVAVVINREGLGYGDYLGNIDIRSNAGIAQITVIMKVAHSFSQINLQQHLPENFRVYPNYPNPWTNATTISLDLPFAAVLHVAIFNALGQCVRKLSPVDYPAGRQIFSLDAINHSGSDLPAGVYFYQIQIVPNAVENQKSFAIFKKLMIIK